MNIDRDDLRLLLEEILEDRSHVDQQLHIEEHEWIREQINLQRARKELMWEAAKNLTQWSVLGIAGAIIYYLQTGHWSS